LYSAPHTPHSHSRIINKATTTTAAAAADYCSSAIQRNKIYKIKMTSKCLYLNRKESLFDVF